MPFDNKSRLWYFLSMKRKSIVKTLREAIESSDLNITQIGELSGVDKAQISRFVNEKRTLTLESAERIAEALGLELKAKKKRRKMVSVKTGTFTKTIVIGKKKAR